MKKVLFVISALEAGGAEKSLVNLLNLFDYENYQVDLLLFKREGIFLKQVPEQVNIIDAPKDLYYLYNFPKLKEISHAKWIQIFSRVLGTIYKKLFYKNRMYQGMQVRWENFYKKNLSVLPYKYDVAISYMHGESMYYVAEKVIAKNKITWVHNDYQALGLEPSTDLPYFKQFQKVVTISDECAEIWKKCFPTIADKIVCIPNLTSSNLVRKMAREFFPKEYINNKEKHILLSVGRLHYQKGFDLGIEIAHELKANGMNFIWYILGKGELLDSLTKRVKELGLDNDIVFLGVRENPYPYMLNAEIIVQPSRYEGKSVVLDEAKILCKPIVVSNYKTVNDQIVNQKEGIIANLNVEEFARELILLMNDSMKRQKLENYLRNNDYGNADKLSLYLEIM